MGETWIPLKVSSLAPNGGIPQNVKALVDTGAILTLLPSNLLAKAGVHPEERIPLKLADGSTIEREVGNALVELDGKVTACRVLFGLPTDEPLVGLTVLEQLGLMVDPVERRLVPTQIKLF